MQPFFGIIGHLGYPPYFTGILGAWYVLAGFALLAPRLPRLKEWAYAGLIFNYTGAAASYLMVGDGARTVIGPIFFVGLTSISWALRPPARRDLSPPSAEGTATVDRGENRVRTIAYWTFTLIAAAEMIVGSTWDLLRIAYVRAVMTLLGYPLHLLLILGAWKLPCGVTLIVPGFPRLKEWAYAGAFFNYSGAVLSHLAVGDGADQWAGPLVFAAITLASWALRPPERRLVLQPGRARQRLEPTSPPGVGHGTRSSCAGGGAPISWPG
jgi:hypothetical protein